MIKSSSSVLGSICCAGDSEVRAATLGLDSVFLVGYFLGVASVLAFLSNPGFLAC